MSEQPKANVKKRLRARAKLSVFAMAAEDVSVNAQIDYQDVLHVRPTWTRKQAEDFLRQHAEIIGTAMVIRGAEMLTAIIGEDDYAN